MSKIPIYVADFETSYSNETNTSWVWCFGYSRINTEKIRLGGSIKEFMNVIFSSQSKKVYFHNLKYDGKFILYYLLKNKYKYVNHPQNEKEFTHLIDETNNYYSITVAYKYNNKINRVTFLDSYKKLPSSIDKIAKDFGMEVNKLKMDYSLIRKENHKLTEEEREYIKHDIIILRKAIEITEEYGMQKMTIGSNALCEFKNIINSKDGLNFRMLFPKLSNEVDVFLRKAYKGGCTMLNEKYANKVTKTYSYDVNSMYPSMLRNKYMPYGNPIYYKGKYKKDEKYPLYIQHIKCEFYLKKNHFPCVQVKGSKFFNGNEWLKESSLIVDLYFTNLDLDLFLSSYDVYNLEYVDGYKFRQFRGIFNEYIDKWYNIKKTSKNKSLVAIAKLYLNALYGKFGTCPVKKSITFELKNDILKRKDTIEEDVELVYLPIAIFTTSYARCYILSCANKNYDCFIYCDTDSIHTSKKVNNIPLDDKKLGYFKFEYSGYGKYLKQKCYLIHYDKEFIKIKDDKIIDKKLVCAGLNQNLLKEDDFEFDNFYIGRKFYKLKQLAVKGGVYLCEQEHIIM